MKRLLLIFAVLAIDVLAQRQGLVTDAVTRSVNRPASFATIPAFRLEGRITLPLTCNNTTSLTVASTGGVGLGFLSGDCTQLAFSNASSLQAIYAPGTTTPATFTAGGSYMFSVQRTGPTATDSFQVKVWTLDATPVGYRSVIAPAWSRLTGNSDILPGNINPGLVVHHECWYSDAIADLANAPMPPDNVCNNGTLTEIGGFLLDGNKTGISGINMTCTSCGSEVYKYSTISGLNDGIYPPPAVQVSVIGTAAAGNPLTIDASATRTFDGSTTTSADFVFLSGPAGLPFSTSGTQATVPFAAEGTYVFGVTVPGSAQKQVSIPISLRDTDGFPVYLSNVKHRTVQFRFNLASVPGATKVVVYVQRPDGTTMAPVTCASSPCTIATEDRMDSHLISRYEYQNSGGTVLASNIMPALVKQTRATKSYTYTKKYPKVWSQQWVAEDLVDTPILMNNFLLWWADKTDKYTMGSAVYEPPIQYNYTPLNPNAMQNVYSDLASFGTSYISRARAVAQGTTYDQLVLHAGQDYIAGGANSDGVHIRWKKQNRFDYAEQNSSGAVTGNGIMFVPDDAAPVTNCVEASGTSDCTIAGYTGFIGVNSPVTGAGFALRAGTLYLAMADPFDTINFAFTAAGTGGGRTVLWEYKTSGGWATLSVTDGTSTLGSTSGTVTFTPPTAWVAAVVHGSNSKYWVRATLSGFTSYPTGTIITGDSWDTTSSVSGQPSEIHPRGWCATDLSGSDRITAADGKWIYDPTPDSTCTAKFRHQSWHLGIWDHNLPIPNTGRTVGGVYVWGRVVVDKVASFFTTPLSNGFLPNALFIDNHVAEPNILFPSTWRTTTEITTHNGYVDAAAGSIAEARAYVRSLFGSNIQVGANGGTFLICKQLDFCKDENSYYPHNGPQRAYTELMGGASGFDPYQSESSYPLTLESLTRNPDQHVLVYYLVSDILNHRERNGTITLWDRGNRGPMTIMASFLFEANEFTYLFPKTGAAYFYLEYDRVFYREESPSYTTTASISPSLTLTATSTSAVSGSWDVTFSAAHGLTTGDIITNGEVAVTVASTPSTTRITGTGGSTSRTDNQTWTKRTVISGTFTTLPAGSNAVRFGPDGQWITLVKINNTSAYSENILMAYGSGIDIYKVTSHTLHEAKPPSVDRIRNWDYWYPALEVEMGDPVGPRYTSYKLACTNPNAGCTDNSGNLNRWQFREFENGYIFHTSGHNESSFPLTLQDQYSPTYTFATETNPNTSAAFPTTLYELRADGTTVPRTSFALRSAEGKVFLKAPITQ